MPYETDLRRSFLEPDDVTKIKEVVWSAQCMQGDIAEKFVVSPSTISAIVKGRMWPEIPWPDGSIGGLPKARQMFIKLAARKRAKEKRHLSGLPISGTSQAQGIVENVNPEMDPRTAKKAMMLQDAEREKYGELPDEWWKNEEIVEAFKQGNTYKFRERYREDAIPPPSVQAEIQPETREQQEKLMPWKDVLIGGADNKLVIQAVKEKDKLLKKAIRMVYYMSQPDNWEDERIVELVLSTKELLAKQE